MKITKPFPYLYIDIDRQGAIRWRLRVPRRTTVTIKGDYGSPEFAANYRAAMESDQKPAEHKFAGKHGTFHALGRSYLRSADFAALASESQRKRRDMVERFLDKYGDLPVARLEHRH